MKKIIFLALIIAIFLTACPTPNNDSHAIGDPDPCECSNPDDCTCDLELDDCPTCGSDSIDGKFIVSTTDEWSNTLVTIQNAGSNKNYLIEINGNIAIPGITDSITTATGFSSNNTNITVTLKGNGKLSTSGQGSIIRLGNSHTFTIDSVDLILEGHNGNNLSLIYVQCGGTLEMKNGIITGNTAEHGGGVYVSKGTFTMTGGEIGGNTTDNGGGGVYVSGGIFTMTGGKISNNTAKGSYNGGGGVYVSGGDFILTGGEISGNAATAYVYSNGAGVYVSGGTFTMTGGVINCNTNGTDSFTLGGSGVYVYNGIFTMNGGEISGNYGDGVNINWNGTFIMNGGKIKDNTGSSNGSGGYGGGGVNVYQNGTFTMNGGEIIDNDYYYGVCVFGTFTMTNGEINNQVYIRSGTFTMAGGKIRDTGVSVNGSTFTMTGGKISGNISGGSGGGVSVEGCTFTMTGGEISGNTAPNGAGVFVSNSIFTMKGGKITDNTASLRYGGGVFILDGTFTMTGGEIIGNYGGNVFSSVAFTIAKDAIIDDVSLYASSTSNASVILASNWAGSISTLNLMGDLNLATTVSHWVNKTVLQAEIGYSLVVTDLLKFPLGNFFYDNGPWSPISSLQPINSNTDGTTNYDLVLENNKAVLRAKP
jgi:hypothetical protein